MCVLHVFVNFMVESKDLKKLKFRKVASGISTFLQVYRISFH